MNKISLVAALAVGLMGCSQFNTDGSDDDFFANGLRGSIGGMQTSNKLAEPKEMAGVEELAITADNLSNMMQLNTPSGFSRISNITNETADFNFRNAFQAGLAACEFLTRTKPNSNRNSVEKVYWIKGGEFCDFEMGGSYTEVRQNAFGVSRNKVTETMTFERVDDSDNPVVSLTLTLTNATQSSGERGVGQTRASVAESTLVMSVELADGREFELMALGANNESRTQIADDTRHDQVSRTQEFIASGQLPDSNMTYEWARTTRTDEKTVETLRINGLLVALD